VSSQVLSPAAFAFDAVASNFDNRYGQWRSVDAQRRAVRSTVSEAFPTGSRILEVGGGTGEDALWLVEHGYRVVLTDASPAMVRLSTRRLGAHVQAQTCVASAESLETTTFEGSDHGAASFDGAFSNFAALNCVDDLSVVARGLARHVRANGMACIVVFGTCSPGEMLVELVRLRPRSAFRRFSRGRVPARLGGREFTVRYHHASDIMRAMHPWFHLVRRRGIGIFVPPSAAEPWISRHPRLLGALEAIDRKLIDTFAFLGDHVLYQFERTSVPVSGS
jgi:ubiquinone/menaquinone biosynthesis C-methylase UbiE